MKALDIKQQPNRTAQVLVGKQHLNILSPREMMRLKV